MDIWELEFAQIEDDLAIDSQGCYSCLDGQTISSHLYLNAHRGREFQDKSRSSLYLLFDGYGEVVRYQG